MNLHTFGVSVFVITLYMGVTVTPDIILSYNTVAFATLESDKGDISDMIKKSCPSYQSNNNNNNIKSLVTDVINACLAHTNQPPTTPNPDVSKFPTNIMTIDANLGRDLVVGTVVITDTASHYSNSYSLSVGSAGPTDSFIIPVGDPYVITVTGDGEESVPVTFETNSCRQHDNTCTGTMQTSPQGVSISIGE